jgi:DNA polymerase-3 subunit chi
MATSPRRSPAQPGKAMPGEVFFYHLTRRTLETTAPDLLEKCLERGWRVTLRAVSPERVEALDSLLWTYRDDSFLPHASAREGRADSQPIFLTHTSDTPNSPDALMLVDGADADAAELTGMARVMTLFDGRDDSAVAAARDLWRRAVAAGARARYWAETEDGRWTQKAESGG